LGTRTSTAALVAAVGSLLLATGAEGATRTVDDNLADCPAATYVSIQDAVDAATTGDTIAVCPGDYAEGTGQPGTNALTITKSLTVKGAGAGLVHISPKATSLTGGAILEAAPDIRNGIGDVIAIVGTPTRPLEVHLSGITADGYDGIGRPIAVEAGIVFLDAQGSVVRSRVTNVVTSEGDNAYTKPGGWRGDQPGYGIVQTSNATLAPVDGARRLVIERTRIDKYNKAGVLIDGAQNDTAPFVASGAINSAELRGDQIVGRTECVNYAGTGNCSNVGLLTTGPLFGQDGVLVTAAGRVTVLDSLISQNLVNGTGAPARSTVAATGAVTPNSTNNANLALGAGIRLVGAGLTSYSSSNGQVILSSASSSNITDNAYGVLNLGLDGTTTSTGTPTSATSLGNVFKAENNFWGLNYYRSSNPGPATAPTDNPPVPENPVSGTAPVVDGAGTTSDSVDYFPFRAGMQADMSAGEWPILGAPIPVDDAAPTVTLTAATTVARGHTLALAAMPQDDFGVKQVTFYDGAATLGASGLPPYAVTEAIPAGAACGVRALTAVAEDSLGQTTLAHGSVTVTGCDAGPGTPPVDPDPTPVDPGPTPSPITAGPAAPNAALPVDPSPITAGPAAPKVALVTPPSTLTAGGATLTLAPSAQAGIKEVTVYLGTRRICTLTAAPWTCRVVPTGADVGGQVLRAIVVDATGQTAETSQVLTVAKFKPRALSTGIASRNRARGTVRKTITGRVRLPAAVTAAQGCRGGSVTVIVKRAGRSISNSQVQLSKSCSFSKRVTAKRVKPGSRAFTYSVRFTGTSVLSSLSTTRRSS
jgi:hypothetical protein